MLGVLIEFNWPWPITNLTVGACGRVESQEVFTQNHRRGWSREWWLSGWALVFRADILKKIQFPRTKIFKIAFYDRFEVGFDLWMDFEECELTLAFYDRIFEMDTFGLGRISLTTWIMVMMVNFEASRLK